MGRKVTIELAISPAQEAVSADLADAEGWGGYERALREVLAEVLGADGLTVDELIINVPLREQGSRSRLSDRSAMSPRRRRKQLPQVSSISRSGSRRLMRLP